MIMKKMNLIKAVTILLSIAEIGGFVFNTAHAAVLQPPVAKKVFPMHIVGSVAADTLSLSGTSPKITTTDKQQIDSAMPTACARLGARLLTGIITNSTNGQHIVFTADPSVTVNEKVKFDLYFMCIAR